MKIFISYSHKDEAALDRLHTHLAVLQREGEVKAWHDRKILAGHDIDAAIMQKLEDCDIFLPLVSPDFLESNYCYENEMQYAINRHASGKIRVVPVIIEPCDWKSTPLKRFKATPKDGKPVSEWQNNNNGYLDVVTELRKIISEFSAEEKKSTKENIKKIESVRQYRVKKDFDEIDIAEFRDKIFNEIRNYFRESINEINNIENVRAKFSDIDNQSFTSMVLNKSLGRGTGGITVRTGSRRGMGMSDIYFSLSENAPPNTSNGGFSIVSDEYDLFLKPNVFLDFNNKERISVLEAAEILWEKLLDQAGITYA
jgi:hypothetical protein